MLFSNADTFPTAAFFRMNSPKILIRFNLHVIICDVLSKPTVEGCVIACYFLLDNTFCSSKKIKSKNFISVLYSGRQN